MWVTVLEPFAASVCVVYERCRMADKIEDLSPHNGTREEGGDQRLFARDKDLVATDCVLKSICKIR